MEAYPYFFGKRMCMRFYIERKSNKLALYYFVLELGKDIHTKERLTPSSLIVKWPAIIKLSD